MAKKAKVKLFLVPVTEVKLAALGAAALAYDKACETGAIPEGNDVVAGLQRAARGYDAACKEDDARKQKGQKTLRSTAAR
jgi:hypothetical protein